MALQSPEAGPARSPARRGRHPPVAGATISGPGKKGQRIGATLVFVDEAGFYLLPSVVRTYAPCGETPLLWETLTHDHLAVISGVTQKGQLFVQIYEGTITSREVVAFLRHLEQHLPGPLFVIWDGAPIHRGRAVQRFLASGHAARVHLEMLPGYAPELNPDEGVWHTLKDKELANLACADLSQLRQELQRAIARLRRRPELIRGYFREAGYL
jgi:transposase